MSEALTATVKHIDDVGEAGMKVPNYPHAAHHIVAGTHPKAEDARNVLKKFGIDINDAANGVFLPVKQGVTESVYHPSMHNKLYFEKVEFLLLGAESKDEVLRILEKIRIDLLNGTF